jgi:hypothetical protein
MINVEHYGLTLPYHVRLHDADGETHWVEWDCMDLLFVNIGDMLMIFWEKRTLNLKSERNIVAHAISQSIELIY